MHVPTTLSKRDVEYRRYRQIITPIQGRIFWPNQLFFRIPGEDNQGKAGEQECKCKVEYGKRDQVRDGRVDGEEKCDYALDDQADVRSPEPWMKMTRRTGKKSVDGHRIG